MNSANAVIIRSRRIRENNMSKMIKFEQLLPADIIVTASKTGRSNAIRSVTSSDVSHSILYLGQNTVIEALGQGVVARSIRSALDSDTILAIALRHRSLTPTQRMLVVKEARKFLGRPYDYTGAAGAGVKSSRGGRAIAQGGCVISPLGCHFGDRAIKENAKPENADKKFFCSELVTRAFELACAPLLNTRPSYIHPGMIHESKVLLYVGHLIEVKYERVCTP
jgi:hypothetical protein